MKFLAFQSTQNGLLKPIDDIWPQTVPSQFTTLWLLWTRKSCDCLTKAVGDIFIQMPSTSHLQIFKTFDSFYNYCMCNLTNYVSYMHCHVFVPFSILTNFNSKSPFKKHGVIKYVINQNLRSDKKSVTTLPRDSSLQWCRSSSNTRKENVLKICKAFMTHEMKIAILTKYKVLQFGKICQLCLSPKYVSIVVITK